MRRLLVGGILGIAIGVACGGRTSGPDADGGTTTGTVGTTTGAGGGTTTGTGGGTTVGTTTGTGGGTTVGTTTGTGGGTTVGGTGGTGTTGGSGGSGGTGGGTIDWDACTGPGQCELAPQKCCTCGILGLGDLRAINSSKRAEFSKQVCSTMPAPCPPCVGINDPNLMARCESGRCRGFDIRTDPTYTKCGSNQECTLRKGLTCCECGADGDWVAVSHLGKMLLAAELCGPNSVCPGCVPVPPVYYAARCVNGACTRVDIPAAPGP